MAPVTTEALILQTFPYGETSRILRLYTREHGLQSAIARGATRPHSHFGGLLEPFISGWATLYLKPTRELQTLAAFELTRSRQALGADLLRFGGASLLAELVLRTSSEEAQPRLFQALTDALDLLEVVPAAELERTILTVMWQHTALLGFGPALDECLVCGRPLGPAEDTRFSYSEGGVLCPSCGQAGGGAALPAKARAALHALVRGQEAPIERTLGHWRLLERYLDHHVLEGGTLRSFQFLAQTLPGS
jgi:DNA repair protein RecO (recombination protein O)